VTHNEQRFQFRLLNHLCSELFRVSWVNLGLNRWWSPSELETEIRPGTWAQRFYLWRLLSSCRTPSTVVPIYIFVYVSISIFAFIDVFICVYIYVYLYVCLSIYLSIYIYIYTYILTYIYVYMNNPHPFFLQVGSEAVRLAVVALEEGAGYSNRCRLYISLYLYFLCVKFFIRTTHTTKAERMAFFFSYIYIDLHSPGLTRCRVNPMYLYV